MTNESPSSRPPDDGTPGGKPEFPVPPERGGSLAREQGIQSLWKAFRNIRLGVFLIFIFAVVHMFTLWQVCNTGMKTATSLEHQGLPALNFLASLQEQLAIYRLHSYEYLFAREEQKAAAAKAVETVAHDLRADIKSIRALLQDGDGPALAIKLDDAFDDLDAEFRKVRGLVDVDFVAAMKDMDQEIPPRTERVAAAANALKIYGYNLSGSQANATFGSFGWIKNNAIVFAAGNIIVAFGAFLFVLLAARRCRAELSSTLAKLDERTHDLARSNAALQTENRERKKAEESLRLLGSAVEQSQESILITDADLDAPGPRIVFVNPAFTTMTGYAAAEAVGQTPRILQGPLTDRAVLSRLRKNLQNGEVFEGEGINYRKGGKEFHMEWRIAPLRNSDGVVTHFVGVQRDITVRKRMEQQMLQSQKMETVGKLAGGVAHEFNSIMTTIIGQSELLLYDLPSQDPLRHNASEISKAAERAAALTRQLLAYGRKQILRPKNLDLNTVLVTMESMLRHLLEEGSDICLLRDPNLKAVKVDAGQIEQVIVNIVMNAADAMPKGGKLTVETANVSLDQEYVSRIPELKPGEYVMLAISDTGMGMGEEVKARLFEPFFSTKDVGQGTGLGLATCYGIVKQSGGHINVYSEAGRGATFKIYLPAVQLARPTAPPRLESADLPRGTETILLVEDDTALREMAGTLLQRLGYAVLTAGNGVEALALHQRPETGHVDLLLTDVVMPSMGGKELADRVRALYPHTRILFTSAFTRGAIVHQGVLEEGVAFLQKPFRPSALARKVRETLDQPDP